MPNYWHYTDADEIVQKMKTYYVEYEKTITRYEDKLRSYFKEKISENGELVFDIESQFWHCYNELKTMKKGRVWGNEKTV